MHFSASVRAGVELSLLQSACLCSEPKAVQGWEVLSTATGAGEQTNPRPHCQLGGAKPFLFMFPHFGSDVKGFSFSSACAINFKQLL